MQYKVEIRPTSVSIYTGIYRLEALYKVYVNVMSINVCLYNEQNTGSSYVNDL